MLETLAVLFVLYVLSGYLFNALIKVLAAATHVIQNAWYAAGWLLVGILAIANWMLRTYRRAYRTHHTWRLGA